MTFISWFSDIGLYLEDYLMYKPVTLAGGIRESSSCLSSTTDGRIRYCCFRYTRDNKLYHLSKIKRAMKK